VDEWYQKHEAFWCTLARVAPCAALDDERWSSLFRTYQFEVFHFLMNILCCLYKILARRRVQLGLRSQKETVKKLFESTDTWHATAAKAKS
jgi:hypothetical protein